MKTKRQLKLCKLVTVKERQKVEEYWKNNPHVFVHIEKFQKDIRQLKLRILIYKCGSKYPQS